MRLNLRPCFGAAVLLCGLVSGGIAQTTAFTYQGELIHQGQPADGAFDLRFTLLRADQSELVTLCADNVPIAAGRFTVLLDPGSEFPAFAGLVASIRIAAREETGLNCGDGSGFIVLTPDQPLTSSPTASRSILADRASNADTFAGLNPSFFTNAGNLTGSLPDSVLGPNVPRLDQSNTWSGFTNTFGNVQANGWIGSETGSVQLRAAGQRGLLIQNTIGIPNIVAGHSGNSISAQVGGSNIGGGQGNRVEGHLASIGGGSNNVLGASGGPLTANQYSVIGGGAFNQSQGAQTTIAGGYLNRALADFAFVGGGERNQSLARYGTIGGGGPAAGGDPSLLNNRVLDAWGTVGGGGDNRAGDGIGTSEDQPYATVSGGRMNRASAQYTAIAGGLGNVASATYGVVAGGELNTASAAHATIGGGQFQSASGSRSFIGGGALNSTTQLYATVAGGYRNQAQGPYATIGGGTDNTASGGGYTTVAGGSVNSATGFVSTVSGGDFNTASGDRSFVGGGNGNIASGALGVIGGGSSNQALGFVSTIAGGETNIAAGERSAVGGGLGNAASSAYATVAGGRSNAAFSAYGTVGGGILNTAGGSGFSTVAGGSENDATGFVATVGGGDFNTASGDRSVIAGGNGHLASGVFSTVAGGFQNRAEADRSSALSGSGNRATAYGALVAGGNSNSATFDHAAVLGGSANRAQNIHAIIGGGNNNIAGGEGSTVAGGLFNNAGGLASLVAGGNNNSAAGQYAAALGGSSGTANGNYAVSAGGFANFATGNHSFAAGKFSQALHPGTFVWGDSQRQINSPTQSTGADQFIIMAAGGVCINTTGPTIRPEHLGGLMELTVGGEISAFTKYFRIDHPLDPENQELLHACVESDELKNIYDGIVTTDGAGFATVTMPAWFAALNENFRYQLTVIDESADDFVLAKIARRIDADHPASFIIKTSKPGVDVSWQVTGIRKDAYARDHPIAVEIPKPDSRKGTYLYPKGFEKP